MNPNYAPRWYLTIATDHEGWYRIEVRSPIGIRLFSTVNGTLWDALSAVHDFITHTENAQ